MSDDDLTLGPARKPESWAQAAQRWERPDDGYDRWRDEYERGHRRQTRPQARPGVLMTLVLAVLLLGAAAFVTAPLFTFRSVRSAAQYGDVQALNEQVDFDAVRQSLRVQTRPNSVEAAPPTSVFRNPLEALRRAWEPATPQKDVDAFLSNEALAGLMSGRAAAPAGAAVTPGGPFPSVRYWGLDRARLAVPAADGAGETVFTFKRIGWFDWKLVGVRLPPEGAPTPAKASAPVAEPTPAPETAPETAPPALDAQ